MGGLIYKELSKQRKESDKSLANGETYVAITKKWLFELLKLHFSQTKGIILADVRKDINALEKLHLQNWEKVIELINDFGSGY